MALHESIPLKSGEWQRFARGFTVQSQVMGALIIREMQSRFGRHNIGYLWIIGEPMLLSAVIGTLHEVAHFGEALKGVHPYAFTLLGYNIFIIFRNVFNKGDHLLDASSHLLLHRIIKPADIIVSKAMVEIIGAICSLIILTTVGITLGIAHVPVRPLYLLMALGLMSWIGTALSILVAVYTYESHLLSRFVHPFSYFMVPLSGAFFTMSFLPEGARNIMQWNPLLAIFEIARYGQFAVASGKFLYPGYVTAVCAALTYWALLSLRGVEKRIHVG